MANPSLTQANFDLRWERLAVLLAMLRVLREARQRFSEEKVRVFNHKDFNQNFVAGTLTLSGVKIGVNTSPEGVLYVRLVADGGDWDVNIYMATGAGGGDLVATANAVADGAVATLTAANSSGLTGSVTLDGTVVAEADDVHQIICLPDFKLQINTHFDKDIDRDGDMERAALDAAAAVAAGLRVQEQRIVGLIESFLALQLGPAVKSAKLDPLTRLSRTVADDDGAIEVAFAGVLEDVRLGMKQNDSGGALPQEVVKAALSVGAVAYESGNIGAGTTPTPTVYEHQEAGVWTGVCEDATIGAQRFRMSFAPSDAARAHLAYDSPILLTLKKEWKDPGQDPSVSAEAGQERPRVGVRSLTIDYARTITNVSGTGLNTTNTLWSETGENADNTDSGVLYVSVETNGSNFDLSFYSDSNKPASSLVAKATNIAAGAAFTATERNGSGLTVFGTAHASIANGNTSTVNLKVFDSDGRTDGDPDRFSFTVTLSSIGRVQELWAEAFGYYLNSDTVGGETVDEYYGYRGGTLLAIGEEIG